MVVMTREAWTDERLDDLKAEMNAGFARVDVNFARVDTELRELRAAIAAMQRAMLHGFIAVFVAMFTGFAALAGLIVAL
jgi:hypothetical protein